MPTSQRQCVCAHLAELTAQPDYDDLRERYPHRSFGIGPKTGYGGTAILAKIEPVGVTIGLPTLPEKDSNAHVVTAEFAKCYVVATYVPNAGKDLKNMDDKKAFSEALQRYLRELDAKKPIVWCVARARSRADCVGWAT